MKVQAESGKVRHIAKHVRGDQAGHNTHGALSGEDSENCSRGHKHKSVRRELLDEPEP